MSPSRLPTIGFLAVGVAQILYLIAFFDVENIVGQIVAFPLALLILALAFFWDRFAREDRGLEALAFCFLGLVLVRGIDIGQELWQRMPASFWGLVAIVAGSAAMAVAGIQILREQGRLTSASVLAFRVGAALSAVGSVVYIVIFTNRDFGTLGIVGAVLGVLGWLMVLAFVQPQASRALQPAPTPSPLS